MKRLLFVFFIMTSLISFAQKKKEKTNYLRREKITPETLFTFCGKKNGSKLKISDISKAENVKLILKNFDGLDILGLEVVVKTKGGEEGKYSSGNTDLPPELKMKLSSLTKGDKLFFYVKTRNRSTQVVNLSVKHAYYVAG